jgi:hypothetical protein
MTPQVQTSANTVIDYFNSMASDHPEAQAITIDYLVRMLTTWMDPRDLVRYAKQLQSVT